MLICHSERALTVLSQRFRTPGPGFILASPASSRSKDKSNDSLAGPGLAAAFFDLQRGQAEI